MRIQSAAAIAAIAGVGALLLPSAPGRAAEETKSDTIGPWEIEAVFKGDDFDRCTISRKLDDDIIATFVRTSDKLTFELESPNWKLDRGEQYKVTMKLGPQSFDTEVAAEPDSVSVDVKEDKFVSALRAANAMHVVAAGATIDVPLDKSRDAFDRLDACVDKNSKAVETNPFVAPPRQP